MGIALDKEQQRALVEDGVVMVKGLLEPELLRRVQACFDWSIVNPGPLAIDASTDAGIYRIDNYNPDALEFYRDTIVDLPFCGLLADAWGSNNVWYYAEELFWRKGVAERTFWHQDTSYSPWGGSHWVNCWMPLNGVPEDYSLEVVRGSHQGTQYDGTAFDHDDPTKPFFGDRANLPRMPDIAADIKKDPAAWDIVSYAMDPGDVLILHPRSLHGGGLTDGHYSERQTLTLRFFGDDAFYSDHIPGGDGLYTVDQRKKSGDDVRRLQHGDPYRSSKFLQVV
jgi:hypothetical protein